MIAALRDAWRAELLKVVTVRGLVVGAIVSALALPLFSLVVAATDGLGAGDTVTSGAATGSVVGLLAFGAWAASVTAGEHAHRTLVVSMASVARRSVLSGAKLAAAATIAGALAVASAVVAWLVVLAVLPDGDHDLGNPAALLAVVVAIVAIAVAGTAAAALTRSSTTAITAVVLAILLPKAAGGLLGGLEPWIVGASPGTVITQVVGGAQLSDAERYPAGTAAAVATMVAVAAAVAAISAWVDARRDV